MDAGIAVPLLRDPFGAGKSAPLDTNAKFCNQPGDSGSFDDLDKSTGEVLQPFDKLMKWELQNQARAYLPRGHRLAKCHRIRRQDSTVQVRMNEEHNRAFYSGLQTCGLVWLCPVCAPKIQAVRAAELEEAIAGAVAAGLVVELVTLTIPHTRRDSLADLEDGLGKAYRGLTNSKGYRHLSDKLHVVGVVVGSEVTWGEGSGWHPHLHLLRFREAGPAMGLGKLAEHDQRLFEMWKMAVERRGLDSPSSLAFNVQDGSQAHKYVQKMASEQASFTWGLSDELARSHTKKGRGIRFTPFDFLRAGAEGLEGPWEALWREYAGVYKGRQQLRWSKGLRELLAVGTHGTDEQIAEGIGEAWSWARELDDADWSVVRKHNARGILLQVAELAGREGVELYLEELHSREPRAVMSDPRRM